MLWLETEALPVVLLMAAAEKSVDVAVLVVEKCDDAKALENCKDEDKTVLLDSCEDKVLVNDSSEDKTTLFSVEKLPTALEICDEIVKLLVIVIPVVVGIAVPLLIYMLSLLPAPQSSLLLPMQGMLQSVAGATTALAAMLLPQ